MYFFEVTVMQFKKQLNDILLFYFNFFNKKAQVCILVNSVAVINDKECNVFQDVIPTQKLNVAETIELS